MGSRFQTYRSMWMQRTSDYADEFGQVFFAKVSPVDTPRLPSDYPRAHQVEHLISAVLQPGGPRHYCFKTAAERDSFVTLYAQYARSDGGLTRIRTGPDVAATPPDSTDDTSPPAGGAS